MDANHSTRTVTALKVYWPLDPGRSTAPPKDETIFEQGGPLAALLSIVRDHGALGDFGLYTSVVEVASGWELFTPGRYAKPTFGEAGTSTISRTAIVTVYIPHDAPSDDVSRAIGAIIAAHPWEVPVIELSKTSLVVRT